MPDALHTIGEFSRMSGLPVKTLRFYHEKGLLIPAMVERETGYRSYDKRNLEKARVIVALRKLDFSLDTILEITASHAEDADILEFLEQRKVQLRNEINRRAEIVQTLDSILARERQTRNVMQQNATRIEEKELQPQWIGGIRQTGRYQDCDKTFGQLGRKLGRHIRGKPMMLHHDQEYREEDADFEPCMPLAKSVKAEGVDVRELPGGRFLTLVHRGPYETISDSYATLIGHAKEHAITLGTPSREVYLKGPGMIFKGNPDT